MLDDIKPGNIFIQENELFIVERTINEPCVVMKNIHSEKGTYTGPTIVGESDLKDFTKLVKARNKC